MKLEPAARKEFESLLTRYPTKEAALLPTLWLVQRQEGWISEEAMEYVAGLLGISPVKVYSVVSFYTMYYTRPMGRHVIQVCKTLSCALLGALDIVKQIEERTGTSVGETSADGRYSLRTVECLGSCGTAPMMQVNDEYHENLTPQRVDELLAAMK